MAAATAAPADDDNNTDNTAATTDTRYAAAFALGERIARALERIARRLPALILEEGDADDSEGVMEYMIAVIDIVIKCRYPVIIYLII